MFEAQYSGVGAVEDEYVAIRDDDGREVTSLVVDVSTFDVVASDALSHKQRRRREAANTTVRRIRFDSRNRIVKTCH